MLHFQFYFILNISFKYDFLVNRVLSILNYFKYFIHNFNSNLKYLFFISISGPPEPVQNCSITNRTSSILMLLCDAGDDGGLPQTFHLEVYSVTAENLITNITVTDTPFFIAEKLSSSSSYILVLYASNTKGRSTSVALTAHTLFSAEPRTSKYI